MSDSMVGADGGLMVSQSGLTKEAVRSNIPTSTHHRQTEKEKATAREPSLFPFLPRIGYAGICKRFR